MYRRDCCRLSSHTGKHVHILMFKLYSLVLKLKLHFFILRLGFWCFWAKRCQINFAFFIFLRIFHGLRLKIFLVLFDSETHKMVYSYLLKSK